LPVQVYPDAMRPLLLALAVTAFAVHATAGVAYDYVTDVEASRYSETMTGRVWVEGESYRAEITGADGTKRGVISRDGDESAVIIDFKKQEVTDRVRLTGGVRSSALFLFPADHALLQGTPNVRYRRGATAIIAGESATEHVIEATFRARTKDGLVGGTYNVVAHIWASEELPPLPMKRPLRSGYARVDAELDEAAKNVRGMVLRHDLEITRTLDGGPPQSERTSTRVTRVERMDVDPEIFSRPTWR
jgi:hypothetical protein